VDNPSVELTRLGMRPPQSSDFWPELQRLLDTYLALLGPEYNEDTRLSTLNLKRIQPESAEAQGCQRSISSGATEVEMTERAGVGHPPC
jgi:hypothetical protein